MESNFQPIVWAQGASRVDVLQRLDSDHQFGIILAAIIFGSIVILSVAGMACVSARAIARGRTEADLKRDMLDRGMSADEIEKVVNATALKDGRGGS